MFDARAESYDDSAMHRWLADHAASLLSVGDHALVVDVAAGTGLAGRALRGRHPSVRVVAVDFAAELLRVAREKGLSAVQADAERLPIGSRTVDAVICVSAAAYFLNAQQAINECARVLRPGGTFLMQAWREDTITTTRLLRRAAALAGVAVPDPNEALGTDDRLRAAMGSAGLTSLTIEHGVWHAAWPEPEGAWRSVLDGPLGHAVGHLQRPLLDHIREVFLSQLRSLITQHTDDTHRALFGVGTAP